MASLDLYALSIPVFIRFLDNLSALLAKGADHAVAAGRNPDELVAARLHPDMSPLSAQVQIACDTSRRCAARLTGREAPAEPDDQSTLDELQQRISRAQDYLRGYQPQDFAGAEERSVRLETRLITQDFTGLEYLLHFAQPNFYFHVSIAHGILRVEGVPIGKMDFMGATARN